MKMKEELEKAKKATNALVVKLDNDIFLGASQISDRKIVEQTSPLPRIMMMKKSSSRLSPKLADIKEEHDEG